MSTIPSKANPAHVPLGTDLVPASNAAGSLDVSLSLNQIAVAVNSALDVLTVGANAQYATLQLAVNAAIAAGNFFKYEPGLYDGILTFTQGSRVVTGDVNTFFSYTVMDSPADGTRSMYITAEDPTGPNVKWYPIRLVVSETELILDVAFEEVTKVTTANAWWYGNPTPSQIVVLDNIDEIVYYNATGLDGGAVEPVISMGISFPNKTYWGGTFQITANSGVVYFDGVRTPEGRSLAFTGKAGSSPVFDVNYINIFTRGLTGNDYVWFESGVGCGRCFISNAYLLGTFDLIIPMVKGRLELYNVITDAVPLMGIAAGNGSGGARGLSTTFAAGVVDCIVRFSKCKFTLRPIGLTTPLIAGAIRLSGADTPANQNHHITVDDCILELDVTADPNSIGVDAAHVVLGILDSDIYFTNTAFTVNGVTVVPANWRSFKGVNPGTVNRLHFKNCGLPKELESDLPTFAALIDFDGSGGNNLNCTVATIDVDEYDILRADTFILDGIDAIKTIPAIKNPVEGLEITFVIKEDATAGHAITWNAVYHFTQGGWTDSTVTVDANKVSTVKFKYMGTAWYETSPANVWTA